MASENFLKYSSLTFAQIVEQINTKLESDSRFDNFRESAIAQTLVEIFAATADLCNYYIERTAEESYFDTAKNRSSVILLSRCLGYDVTRPIPAGAKLKFKLRGNLQTEVLNTDEVIQIPYHTVFTYGDQKYILKKTLQIDVGGMLDDITVDGDNFDSGWITVDINGEDIDIVQGEIKEKIIYGETNPQVGSKFQVYNIDDKEFSNVYGSSDYTTPTTKVWVGNLKSDDTQYSIDRRSLINWESIEDIQAGETAKVCVVRTSLTEGIDVMFGDSRYASLGATVSAGPTTTYDNVYVQYLATKGSLGNKTGLKDKITNISGKVYTTISYQEVTGKIQFAFNTNTVGGADLETIDEIRSNAPNIYYSLDRLVSKRDYSTYLKSLTSPINIKNAYAWGEQEEIRRQGIDAIKELFNIVFFTCVGSLYNITSSPYSVKTFGVDLDDSVLDFNYNPNEAGDNSYFNVYVKNQIVNQLKEYDVSATRWQIFSYEDNTTSERGGYDNGSQIFSVLYSSDDNIPNISGTHNITVNVSALKNASSSDVEFLQDLAAEITSQMILLTDTRGKNSTNDNYGGLAFPDATLTFNTSETQFQLRHGENDPCQVVAISGSLGTEMGFDNVAGGYVLFSSSRELGQKIITVLDLLNERSQVTINNIYVSPIIHGFDLKGDVYLNQLYDRNAERTKINDSIYSFLNNNANFNAPIYISNIVELIEKYPSVKYADIRLVPQTITGGPFYKTYNNGGTTAIENFSWDSTLYKLAVYGIIDSHYANFVNSPNNSDTSGSSEKIITYSNSFGTTTVQDFDFSWNSEMTVRKFFEVMAKNIYDDLKNTNITNIMNFADSTSFNDLISSIYKDNIYAMRFNMLDTKGNIAEEKNSSGTIIRGGYSLGSEIVKVNIQLVYRYST